LPCAHGFPSDRPAPFTPFSKTEMPQHPSGLWVRFWIAKSDVYESRVFSCMPERRLLKV
jgi:hypothetical protein